MKSGDGKRKITFKGNRPSSTFHPLKKMQKQIYNRKKERGCQQSQCQTLPPEAAAVALQQSKADLWAYSNMTIMCKGAHPVFFKLKLMFVV